MEKTTVLIQQKHRRKLAKLAKQEHVSLSEITRRAIEVYHPILSSKEFEEAIEIGLKKAQETIEAVESARAEIRKTLDYFEQKERMKNAQIS